MNNNEFSSHKPPKDCWNAHLLENAQYSKTGLPLFKCSESIPPDVVSFKNVSQSPDNSKWVHFYENDNLLELVWESPEFYTNNLRRFPGIISPDLSIYRDMPQPLQSFNNYRNRVLAHWFSEQGFNVIPNIRWGDENTYPFCFDGIEANKPVCVSTLGTLRHKEDRECFRRGFAEMVKRLSPSVIIIYGQMPADIFSDYQISGIPFSHFDTDAQKAQKRRRV